MILAKRAHDRSMSLINMLDSAKGTNTMIRATLTVAVY